MGAIRQQEISAAKLGLDDVAINSSTNSNQFATSGFDQLTIFVKYTRSAGTGVTFQIETTEDNGSTWHKVQTTAIASGVVTLSDATYTKVSSSSTNYAVNIPINCEQVRISSLIATGTPTASDKATVRVRLGAL